jgi:hypothetical protein
MTRPSVAAASVVAIAALALPLAPAPAGAVEPDYRGYADFLYRHVAVASVDKVITATAVDYVGLHRDGSSRATMRAIRRQLLAVAPGTMSPAERRAWGINLYNFLVIQAVLDASGPDGAPPASVRDVKGFFDSPRVETEGRRYSLDAFERHFLFADFDRRSAMPPAGLDPRVHFAIVCAARGCPLLVARPYRAATLDSDLDAVSRMTLRSSFHVRRTATGRYEISSIFDWYRNDFGGRRGVIEFLKRLGPDRLRFALEARGDSALAGFIPWDWRLNQLGPEFRDDQSPGR